MPIWSIIFVKSLQYPAPAEKNIENHPPFSSRSRFGGLFFVKQSAKQHPAENSLWFRTILSPAPEKSRVLTKILVQNAISDENHTDAANVMKCTV